MLKWNHSVLSEPDFLTEWAAIESAFALALDHGNSRCPNPQPDVRRTSRPRSSCNVRFAEMADVYIMDEVYPSVLRLAVPLHAFHIWPVKPWSLIDWSRPVTPAMNELLCKSGRMPCTDIPWQQFTRILLPKMDGHLPLRQCSIMDAFIQLARLPEDAAGHNQGAGGQLPGGRPPDFTDNMMAQIDPAVVPLANLATLGLSVRTWYIHHVRHPRNADPRIFTLGQ